MTAKKRIRTKIKNPSAKPPQRGERTQSHDQVIKPVSFKVMNTMVSKPRNKMPPLDDVDDDAMVF